MTRVDHLQQGRGQVTGMIVIFIFVFHAVST